jgi:K+-transporting ATPase ATPase B chain
MSSSRKRSLWDARIVRRALIDALAKLNPRKMMKSPVMFVVETGSVITTIYLFRDLAAHKDGLGFDLQITLWLCPRPPLFATVQTGGPRRSRARSFGPATLSL